MSTKKTRFIKGIILAPDSVNALEGIEGELKVNGSGKLQATLGAASREIVTADQSQVLTQKTIDAASNTISNLTTSMLASGVLDTDLTSVSASDDTLPSAKAVKTYVDAQVGSKDEASEITVFPAVASATNVQTALSNINTAIVDHIADTSGAHAASAISVSAITNLTATDAQAAFQEIQGDIDSLTTNKVTGPASSVDTQIARFDGTTGKVIDAVSGSTLSDTGIITSNQFIANQALVTNQAIAFSGISANTSTGSNVVLSSNSYARLRLTGVGLISISGINSPTSGRLFLISNETGADISIIHDDPTVTTVSNRFYTPDGSDFTFKNNSMIWYMYTSTINRHVIISGGGSGGGSASAVSTTIDTFNGNNSTTTFTLTVDPLSKDNTQVYVNGVYQNKATYSVTGTSLQFTQAPPTGIGNIEVKILSLTAVGGIPNATVSTKGIVKLAGDLGGTADLPKIIKPTNTVSALDVDWSLGYIHYKEISANSTFTFSNLEDGKTISLIIKNTGASTYNINFPATIKTTSLDLTIQAGKQNIYTFISTSTSVYATAVTQMA